MYSHTEQCITTFFCFLAYWKWPLFATLMKKTTTTNRPPESFLWRIGHSFVKVRNISYWRGWCVIDSFSIDGPFEVGWATNIGFLVAFQQSLFTTNHWPSWNGHIIVGWIVTSPINSGTHFSVKQSREEGLSGFKKHEWIQHTATGSCCHTLRCNTQLPSHPRHPWRLLHWRSSQHVCGRADLDFVQKECPSHTDLLERLLQLWTLHCLSRTYNFGPAVSNKLNAQSDNMGVFLPAVLPVDWQLDRRRFQEDVRIRFACTLRYHQNSE